MPGDFIKGQVQYIEKIKRGIIYWLRKNNFHLKFFRNLEKKFALCLFGEYAKERKKY